MSKSILLDDRQTHWADSYGPRVHFSPGHCQELTYKCRDDIQNESNDGQRKVDRAADVLSQDLDERKVPESRQDWDRRREAVQDDDGDKNDQRRSREGHRSDQPDCSFI